MSMSSVKEASHPRERGDDAAKTLSLGTWSVGVDVKWLSHLRSGKRVVAAWRSSNMSALKRTTVPRPFVTTNSLALASKAAPPASRQRCSPR